MARQTVATAAAQHNDSERVVHNLAEHNGPGNGGWRTGQSGGARGQVSLGRCRERFAEFASTKPAQTRARMWATFGRAPDRCWRQRTFSGETASGWQQVNFTTPVAITANTVYVASYHANTGHYSVNSNYFASAGVDNAPLHALANGVSGGNGVYAYGASSALSQPDLEFLQLLGGCGVSSWAAPYAELDCGNAGQSQASRREPPSSLRRREPIRTAARRT